MNEEIAAELDKINVLFTSRDYDELEARLQLRAASLGWTGDPLQQPPEVVLVEARSVLRDRGATDEADRRGNR